MENDKKLPIAIVTGSAGLIGSQAVKFLHEKGFEVIGIDNDMRSYFFGNDASTKPNNFFHQLFLSQWPGGSFSFS